MKLTRPMIISGAITLAGGIGGFFYWQQVGCLTGTCPITSSPVISSLYGGVMGFLLAGILTPGRKDR